MSLRKAQKMFLVPPHQLNRITQQQQPTAIREAVEDDLDAKMRAVLDEPGLTPHEKIKKYNALLQRYLTLMKQGQKEQRRVTLTLQRESEGREPELSNQQNGQVSSQESDDTDHVITEVLKSFPPRDRNNTEYILKKISESDKSWNAKGEFVYKGHAVKGYHMTDLLKHLSHSYKLSRSAPPTGWLEFLNTLADLNIPSYAVKNSQARDQYRALKTGTDDDQNVMAEKETTRARRRGKMKKQTTLSPTWIGISP
ncbi:acintoc2 [Xyrichtys novacula]|uniref:TPA_asm: acintoc2 n=1 Tax=Xyrichtys novacula TaxID=13765 RepID=A0AAV1G1J8_XYRNO|nr:acintoc2 [Xyrichtys novacula]